MQRAAPTKGEAMSQDVMIALAREVTRDLSAQPRIEALSDEELARLGLDEHEIRSIRDGFFDRVLRLGMPLDDVLPPASGCCSG